MKDKSLAAGYGAGINSLNPLGIPVGYSEHKLGSAILGEGKGTVGSMAARTGLGGAAIGAPLGAALMALLAKSNPGLLKKLLVGGAAGAAGMGLGGTISGALGSLFTDKE